MPPDRAERITADYAINHAVLITMDGTRRVIRDGAVAISGKRIVAVGASSELIPNVQARQTIDASRCVVMPGLVDLHGKAGHAVIRSLGEGLTGASLRNLWDDIMLRHATLDWM